MTLKEWALRWGIPPAAMQELAGIPALEPVPFDEEPHSESHIQAKIRLEAARTGVIHAWRNNSGAGWIVGDRKKLCAKCVAYARSFTRWGLGNDSDRVNAVIKSSDLIGWRKRVVTPQMVGTVIAQYWQRECKRSGWIYNPKDEREAAQMRWHLMALAAGADSAMVNGEGSCRTD